MTLLPDIEINPRTTQPTTPWRQIRDTLGRLETTQSLSEIADELARSARELLRSDGATFVAREGDQCHYVSESAIGPLWRGLRFPLSSCISGWVMLHRETAVIDDILVDPRIPQTAYEPTFVRSLIMTPVGHEAAHAAIGFYWKSPRTFDEETVSLAETLAAAAAPVIAHRYTMTSLLQERERSHLVHESLDMGQWQLDPHACALTSSAVFKSHFDRALDSAFTYRDLMLCFAADDQARLQQGLSALIRTGAPLKFSARIRCGDETVRSVELVAVSEPDASGLTGHISGVSRVVRSPARPWRH